MSSKLRLPEFVIHKHKAKRLHYDFRLEAGGVLKSWALPKGPPQKPGEKRLAILVEDHPLEYKLFEGIIPEGKYGAGEVSIWDQGTYSCPSISGKIKTETAVLKQMKNGELKIIVHGNKLTGEYILIHFSKNKSSDHWLMIRKK